MSADSMDDLHGAEDMADALAEVLRKITARWDAIEARVAEGTLVPAARAQFLEHRADVSGALAAWDDYCRPTCGAEGKGRGECQDDDPDCCGCPCHRDEDEAGPTELAIAAVKAAAERFPNDLGAQLRMAADIIREAADDA